MGDLGLRHNTNKRHMPDEQTKTTHKHLQAVWLPQVRYGKLCIYEHDDDAFILQSFLIGLKLFYLSVPVEE